MLENQVSRAAPNEPEAHPDARIISARMANGRVVGKCHAGDVRLALFGTAPGLECDRRQSGRLQARPRHRARHARRLGVSCSEEGIVLPC